jgi:hypothetical protein
METLHYLKMEVNAMQVANCHILQLHGKISATQRIQLMQTMRTTRDKMILLAFFGIGGTGHRTQSVNVHSGHLFRLKLESTDMIPVTNHILPTTACDNVTAGNQMISLATALNRWRLLVTVDDR